MLSRSIRADKDFVLRLVADKGYELESAQMDASAGSACSECVRYAGTIEDCHHTNETGTRKFC